MLKKSEGFWNLRLKRMLIRGPS